MGATEIDLSFSAPLSRGPWPTDAEVWLDATKESTQTQWTVFQLRLRERLSELSRCELILARPEPPRPPPPPDVDTFWDKSRRRMDKLRDRSQDIDNRENDYKSAPSETAAENYGKAWENLGDEINDQADGAMGDASDALDNWEQDLLGLTPAAAPWLGAQPPNPWQFLGTFRSVRIARALPSGGFANGRWLSGVVSEFEDLGTLPSYYRAIRIVLVPTLHRLSLRRDQRIFEDKNAIEIVEQVFEEAQVYRAGAFDFGDVAARLPKRPYTVQYGETDYDFVRRILHEEGLLFRFEHRLSAERLVVFEAEHPGTSPIQTVDRDDQPRVILPYAGGVYGERMAKEEVAGELSLSRRIVPHTATERTFNFSDPYRPIEREQKMASDPTQLGIGLRDVHVFDAYPGSEVLSFDEQAQRYDASQVGRTPSVHRHYAVRQGALTLNAQSNALLLTAGERVALVDDRPQPQAPFAPELSRQGTFYVTATDHFAQTNPIALGKDASPADVPTGLGSLFEDAPDTPYLNRFSAVPDGTPVRAFAPPAKPRIDGVQTAIVLGPADEAPTESSHDHVLVDKLGRVRVRFPWDRDGDDPDRGYWEGRSCWVRVAHRWAGFGWGTSFVPRAGTEVLVAFEDGDPDRPLIVGSLYSRYNPAPMERAHIPHDRENQLPIDDQRLHYDPDKRDPDEPSRDLMMIRTRSHLGPGGEPDRTRGFNEISFDDTDEAQRFRVHAERDLRELVEKDHKTHVLNDQVNVVQGEQRELVLGQQDLIVYGSRDKKIAGHEHSSVGADRIVTLNGTEELAIDKHRRVELGSDTVEIGSSPGKKRELRVDGHRLTAIEKNDTMTVAGERNLDIGGEFESAGKPLKMEQTDPAGGEGSSIGADEDGLTLEAKGDPGRIRVVARGNPDGPVRFEASDTTLETGKDQPPATIRFEAGDDVWLEISPQGVELSAPKQVTLGCGTSTVVMGQALGEAGDQSRTDYEQIVMALRAEVKPGQPPPGGEGVLYWSMKAEGNPGEHDEDFDDKSDDEVQAEVSYDDPSLEEVEESSMTSEGSSTSELFDHPGLLLTGDDFVIDAAGIAVTGGKGINIQEGSDADGAVRTRRLLSNQEEELLEDVGKLRKKVEEKRKEVAKLRETFEKAKAKSRKEGKEADKLFSDIHGAGGAFPKNMQALKKVMERQRELMEAEKHRDEVKKEIEEEGIRDEGPDEGTLQVAEERVDDAEKARDKAKEEHAETTDEYKKMKAEYDREEQEAKQARKERRDASAALNKAEAELKRLEELLAKREEEAKRRTAPRTNG